MLRQVPEEEARDQEEGALRGPRVGQQPERSFHQRLMERRRRRSSGGSMKEDMMQELESRPI